MIETSNLIANAKENYYKNEGKKLLDSSLVPKKYWSTLNSFLTNKNMPTSLFKNGESVVDYPTKAETSITFSQEKILNIIRELSIQINLIS